MLAWRGGRRRLAKEKSARRKLEKAFNSVANPTNRRGLFSFGRFSRNNAPEEAQETPLSPLENALNMRQGASVTTSLDVLAISAPTAAAPPQQQQQEGPPAGAASPAGSAAPPEPCRSSSGAGRSRLLPYKNVRKRKASDLSDDLSPEAALASEL